MSVEYDMVLSRAWLVLNKNQKYFSLPDHQLAENRFLALVFSKRKRKNKSEFVNKFVGIILAIILI